MRAYLVGLLLFLLIQAQPPATAPLTPDSAIGAWQGEAEHAGERRAVIIEFARGRDGNVWALVSLPAIHASRMVIGRAETADDGLRVGTTAFTWNAGTGILSVTLPADIVPKYTLRVALRRMAAVSAVSRPAIDAPPRQPVWTFDLGAPSWADALHAAGTVYVGAEDGRMHAVDGSSGRERWTFQAGGAIRAAPALVAGDLVFQADDGMLYGVEARSGRERWKLRISEPTKRVPISDPASRYENRASGVAVAGNRLFVGTHDGRIVAVHARTHQIAWAHKTGDSVTATPVVSGGRVFCGSFDGRVYALDRDTGRVVWTQDTGAAVTTAVGVAGPTVIAGSRSYDLAGLAATTGSPRWTRYIWFSWVESPVTVSDGVAFVGSSDAARVHAIDPATGRLIWAADAGGSAWAQPAVTSRVVYQSVVGVLHYIAPHRGGLLAIDRSTGRPLWYHAAAAPEPAPEPTAAYGFAGGAAVGTLVYAAGLDGRLYAFDR